MRLFVAKSALVFHLVIKLHRDFFFFFFLLEKVILWIKGLYFSQKQLFEVKNISMDLFITKIQLFSSQDVK